MFGILGVLGMPVCRDGMPVCRDGMQVGMLISKYGMHMELYGMQMDPTIGDMVCKSSSRHAIFLSS